MTKTCTPCTCKSPQLTIEQASKLLEDIPQYTLIEVDNMHRITKEYPFKNFKEALAFTNEVGLIAEEQNHHPQIILEWAKVTVSWWTHAIGGLHENDFIMAARTESIKEVKT